MKFKTLSNGERIPVLGFGVFQVQKAGAARQAIKQGLVTTKRTLIEFIVDSDKLRIH